MSADNDKNNHVMPNESEEDKLPDSLDPKARPDAEAAREELFKQNILMDVDERPEGIEAQEQIEDKPTDESVLEDDRTGNDDIDVKSTSENMEYVSIAGEDQETDAADDAYVLQGVSAENQTVENPEIQNADNVLPTSNGMNSASSAFIKLSVDQQIEDALSQAEDPVPVPDPDPPTQHPAPIKRRLQVIPVLRPMKIILLPGSYWQVIRMPEMCLLIV